MSITLNRFSTGVLTAAQLNALVDAIVAKHNNGITTNDLASPLKLPGNLDMQQFDILHLYKLWGVYNLADRSSGTDLQGVLTAVNAAGGGVILLPANTTETIGTSGVTIGANTMIVGEGDTSVLATTGTLAGHQIRNMANGNSGITFMNLKLDNTGASSGAFDMVAMTRTSNVKFIDCTFAVGRQSGISLRTDSAGSACINTWITRCRFDLTASGVNAVLMQDVQGVAMRECKVTSNVASTYGVRFSAFGAGSLCDDVTIADNKFTLSAATQVGISIVNSGAASITGLQIDDNRIVSTGTLTVGIDVQGDGGSVVANAQISHNKMRITDLVTAGIRVQGLAYFNVDANEIVADSSATGQGTGILIGATQRSGSVNKAVDYVCAGNNVTVDGASFVFCHPGSGTMRCNVSDNKGLSEDTPEFQIWNLGAVPTTLTFDMQIIGNMRSFNLSATAAAWRNFTDLGSTWGGIAGSANNSNLVVVGNSLTGAGIADAGANIDFRLTADAGTRKYNISANIQ